MSAYELAQLLNISMMKEPLESPGVVSFVWIVSNASSGRRAARARASLSSWCCCLGRRFRCLVISRSVDPSAPAQGFCRRKQNERSTSRAVALNRASRCFADSGCQRRSVSSACRNWTSSPRFVASAT